MSRIYLESCSCKAPRCLVCNADTIKSTKNFKRLNISAIEEYIKSQLKLKVYEFAFRDRYGGFEINITVSKELDVFEEERFYPTDPDWDRYRMISIRFSFILHELRPRERDPGYAITVSQINIHADPSYICDHPDISLRETYRSRNFTLRHAIDMVNASFAYFSVIEQAQSQINHSSLADIDFNQMSVR